jgi:cytochrome P450
MALASRLSLDAELELLFAGELETIQDPYPIYDRLREEAPVHVFRDEVALISAYDDVKSSYRDAERFPQPPTRNRQVLPVLGLSDEDRATLAEIHRFELNFISRKNGADHVRVRGAVHRYFTPARVAALETTFQALFDELIGEHAGGDVFDFVDFAYLLPLLVITDLLGVPREDALQVKAWGDAINPRERTPETIHAQRVALEENRAYACELVERHRTSPDRSDLIEAVLGAGDQGRLSEDELYAFFVHTLFAGHETTQYMIVNGLFAFFRHPDQWELLCHDPELAASAVEEVLRFDPVVPTFAKRTACEVEVGGVTLPAGLNVLLMLAGANRDPRVFSDPGAFDVTRRPNDHFSLGFGPHFCLGANLARMEGRIVFGTLARRFPGLELAADAATIRYHHGLRGLDRLPVRLA